MMCSWSNWVFSIKTEWTELIVEYEESDRRVCEKEGVQIISAACDLWNNSKCAVNWYVRELCGNKVRERRYLKQSFEGRVYSYRHAGKGSDPYANDAHIDLKMCSTVHVMHV